MGGCQREIEFSISDETILIYPKCTLIENEIIVAAFSSIG
jgi:hypothetical protein